jgi:hypothetical protein
MRTIAVARAHADRKAIVRGRARRVAKDTAPARSGRLLRFLERQSAAAFFGKVTVSFQNGKVCDVTIEQTRKLDEL